MDTYLALPPRYSEAISTESSWKWTCQSCVGGSRYGGAVHRVSMKFSRTPLLQSLFDFLQFRHIGVPSSHFRCRSRHVRHPVRTLLGFDVSGLGATSLTGVLSETGLSPIVLELVGDFFCFLTGAGLPMDPFLFSSTLVWGGVRRVDCCAWAVR